MQADTVIGLHQQPGLDSFEALERWAEQNIARQQEAKGGCNFGSLAGELAETDAETRAELAAGFTRWEALFREGLQAMSDRGELRPDADPALLAAGLLAALQGGMLLTKTTRDIRHLEAALKTAVDHVRSYAAVPSSGARAQAGSRTLAVGRQ
jgi:TetR/AcrR family transcriptional repressor of nem operon